jgi:hypothetical protein
VGDTGVLCQFMPLGENLTIQYHSHSKCVRTSALDARYLSRLEKYIHVRWYHEASDDRILRKVNAPRTCDPCISSVKSFKMALCSVAYNLAYIVLSCHVEQRRNRRSDFSSHRTGTRSTIGQGWGSSGKGVRQEADQGTGTVSMGAVLS